jgi:hypothetical protein
MIDPKTILFVLYLAVGAAFIGLSTPLVRGRIAPNAWYGFRIKRTMENPGIWYPANRYAGYHLLALGIAIVVAASTMYALHSIGFVCYALSCLTVTLAGLAVGVIRSIRRLDELDVAHPR